MPTTTVAAPNIAFVVSLARVERTMSILCHILARNGTEPLAIVAQTKERATMHDAIQEHGNDLLKTGHLY